MLPSARLVAHRHMLRLASKRIADAFEEFVEGKTFRNPDTGNEVQFGSLPKSKQDEVRAKYRKMRQKLEKADKDKGLKENLESLGKKAKKFLDEAPESVNQFITDPEHRKEVLESSVEALKKSPGKVSHQFVLAAKEEGRNFTRAGEGIANLLRGEEVTVAQKQAFKNVAKKVAIGVAGAVLAGTGPLAAAGAFCASLVQSIAVRAVSGGISELDSVREELGLVGQALHALTHLASDRRGDKKSPSIEDVIGKYVELKVSKAIEDLTDDDVIEALKGFDKGVS